MVQEGGRPQGRAAACSCGVAYINGWAWSATARGIMMSRSRPRCSEHACSVLAWANECGHGFNKDPEGATLWYKKMQEAPCRDSVDSYRERRPRAAGAPGPW